MCYRLDPDDVVSECEEDYVSVGGTGCSYIPRGWWYFSYLCGYEFYQAAMSVSFILLLIVVLCVSSILIPWSTFGATTVL